MLQDEQGGVCHYDAADGDFDYTGRANAGEAAFLFVEHHPATFAGGQPGDVVIRLERVPAAAERGAAHAA